MNIAELLTPRAIAYWLAGDASLKSKGRIQICTDNYFLNGVELLRAG
jgi:hypothetical protein